MAVGEIIAGTAGALEIGEVIVHMVKEAKRDGSRLGIPEIVSVLPAHTAAACANAAKELRGFQADLSAHHIDTKKSLQELEQETAIWRVGAYRAVRRVRKRIEAIKNEIIDLHDDAVASAQCLEDSEFVPRSYKQAADSTKAIREMAAAELPIGKMIDSMASDMESLAERLRDASKPRK
jgi:hypothetical protein